MSAKWPAGKARIEMEIAELHEAAEALLRSLDDMGTIDGPLGGDEPVMAELVELGLVECVLGAWRLTPDGDAWCNPVCPYCAVPTDGSLCPGCRGADGTDRDAHDRDHMPGRI